LREHEIVAAEGKRTVVVCGRALVEIERTKKEKREFLVKRNCFSDVPRDCPVKTK
jgi:hypothetical protein